MKVSEINLDIVEQYLQVEIDRENLLEVTEIESYIDAAKSYLYEYTELSLEEVEDKEYLTIPVLILVSNFYENKSMEGTRFINDTFNRFLKLGKRWNL